MRGRRLARSCTNQGEEQWQRVVEHVGCNSEHEASQRCEIAQPDVPGLQGETEERAEEAREQSVPSEPKERVASSELRAVGWDAILGVALGYIKRRLGPIDPAPHEPAVDNAIAHVVELGAQQPKDQQYAKRLRDLLSNRRGDRGSQHQRGVRSQSLLKLWVLADPHIG